MSGTGDSTERAERVAFVNVDEDDDFAAALYIRGETGDQRIFIGAGVEPGRYDLVRWVSR